jgi:outer membrane protein
MKNNKITYIQISVLFVAVVFLFYKYINIPTVKYVRSADLIYGFDGMKEAHLLQQKTSEELKLRLDTLQMDFQKSVNLFNNDYSKLTKQERIEREKILGLQQENLRNYSGKTDEEIKSQDNKLTAGVLNQVNAFVQEYAKQKGYNIILGTTSSGNLLYADEGMDITEEVIKAMNENYINKSSAKE